MRKITLLIFYVLWVANVLAQNKTTGGKTEPNFANQGEQEAYWAKQLFAKEYQPQVFEKFKGSIAIIGKDSIKYDTTILGIDIKRQPFRDIFEKGIVYPDIINNFGRHSSGEKKFAAKPDTSNIIHITANDFKRFFQYTVASVEEQPFLNRSPKARRFKFLLFNRMINNPEVCFIELTNDTATANTSLSDFIAGARLTFFTHAWVDM